MSAEIIPAGSGQLTHEGNGRPDVSSAAVFLNGKANPRTRRTYRSALEVIAEFLAGEPVPAENVPWHELTPAMVEGVRRWLADQYSAATVNNRLSALRGVLRTAWRLGYLDGDTYRRLADIDGLKEEKLPSGRRLTARELQELKAVCEADESPSGARDLALLAVLARGGLRRSEAVALDVDDYRADPEGEGGNTAELVVRGGKGGKERIVPLANGAKDAVDRWLETRGPEPGPLFVPVDKTGSVEIRRLSPVAVYRRLERRRQEADLSPVRPHDLRRTAATDLLDAGNDLAVTQRMLGHSDPATTARYDRRGEEAKRRAAATLPF